MDFTNLATLFTADNFRGSVTAIVGFVILSLIFWIISNFTKKPINLKLGIASVTFGKKDNDEPKMNQKTLDRCRSFLTTKEIQIHKLRQEIFERQLNFCDEKMVEIKDLFMAEYFKMLLKHIGLNDDGKIHPSFRNYRMMIDLMLNSCIKEKTFKPSMRQNHLLELTLDTWEGYIEHKVGTTIALIKRDYDDNYPDDSVVPRKDVDESNERIFEKIKPMIISMYRKAREISVDVKNKIDIIESEIDEGFKKENFVSIVNDDDI